MSSRTISRFSVSTTLALLAFAMFSLTSSRAQNSSDPWSAAQTVHPDDFVKTRRRQVRSYRYLRRVQRLFTAGHIRGAQLHGSGGSAEGLAQLKSWAASLPRTTNIVIYCGCCPMERCPNMRPAFSTLHDMGFTKLRALILPHSFAKNWADKGLPYEKAQ